MRRTRLHRRFLGLCVRLVIFIGLIQCWSAYSTAQQATLPAETRTRMEDAVSKFMTAARAPGVAVAVVSNGQEAWSEGFGMADLENNVPATPQTLFRLASVSKPITAIAAMQLWERHQLDLDAPVQKYCPAFPQKEFPISTRQVLGHLGGIRHYHSESDDDIEVNNTKHFDDPIAGGLQFFAKDPLVAKPGTKFNYSTHGFTLVGCAAVMDKLRGIVAAQAARQPRILAVTSAGSHLQTVLCVTPGRWRIVPRRESIKNRSASG